jgi:hypothetical protein
MGWRAVWQSEARAVRKVGGGVVDAWCKGGMVDPGRSNGGKGEAGSLDQVMCEAGLCLANVMAQAAHSMQQRHATADPRAWCDAEPL